VSKYRVVLESNILKRAFHHGNRRSPKKIRHFVLKHIATTGEFFYKQLYIFPFAVLAALREQLFFRNIECQNIRSKDHAFVLRPSYLFLNDIRSAEVGKHEKTNINKKKRLTVQINVFIFIDIERTRWGADESSELYHACQDCPHPVFY
jgi:hypothetical protein